MANNNNSKGHNNNNKQSLPSGLLCRPKGTKTNIVNTKNYGKGGSIVCELIDNTGKSTVYDKNNIIDLHEILSTKEIFVRLDLHGVLDTIGEDEILGDASHICCISFVGKNSPIRDVARLQILKRVGQQSNPCGQQSNPCGQQSNPCGQQSNPCGQQSNPCGQQSNPCGRQSNPCGRQSNPCGRQIDFGLLVFVRGHGREADNFHDIGSKAYVNKIIPISLTDKEKKGLFVDDSSDHCNSTVSLNISNLDVHLFLGHHNLYKLVNQYLE